jgi:enoyl-CoA hydratase/carnithine racemase
MQARPYKTLLVTVDAGVATVTLNRPERRNALGAQMTNELLYALERVMARRPLIELLLCGKHPPYTHRPAC